MLGPPRARGEAVRMERTLRTERIARPANRRADVHQRLREIPGAAARNQRARGLVDGGTVLHDRGREGVEARDHARDIAVDRRGGFVKRDRRDRRGRVGPDARQRAQGRFVARKPPSRAATAFAQA